MPSAVTLVPSAVTLVPSAVTLVPSAVTLVPSAVTLVPSVTTAISPLGMTRCDASACIAAPMRLRPCLRRPHPTDAQQNVGWGHDRQTRPCPCVVVLQVYVRVLACDKALPNGQTAYTGWVAVLVT
jgi:hypothetical protein